MSTSALNAARLRGIALTVIIVAVFAAVWGANGSVALPGLARTVTMALVLIGTIIWLGIAVSFYRVAERLPTTPDPTATPFRTRSYWLAVLAQVVAIPIVSRLLVLNGHPDAVISGVAAIVGLHFFGLIPAFRSWLFGIVGSAMVLLAAISLVLPASVVAEPSGEQIEVRTAVVGLGCAAILWAGIVPIVTATRLQLMQ